MHQSARAQPSVKRTLGHTEVSVYEISYSGSGSMAVAQLAAGEAIVHALGPPAAVAGCSGGALVAAGHAFGVNAWVVQREFRLLFQSLYPDPIVARAAIQAIVGDAKMGDARIPCRVSATVKETGQNKVFSAAETPNILLADALMASCALNVAGLVLPAVVVDGVRYTDGGYSANLLPGTDGLRAIAVGFDDDFRRPTPSFTTRINLSHPRHNYLQFCLSREEFMARMAHGRACALAAMACTGGANV